MNSEGSVNSAKEMGMTQESINLTNYYSDVDGGLDNNIREKITTALQEMEQKPVDFMAFKEKIKTPFLEEMRARTTQLTDNLMDKLSDDEKKYVLNLIENIKKGYKCEDWVAFYKKFSGCQFSEQMGYGGEMYRILPEVFQNISRVPKEYLSA